jgi:hypothetical protein
MSGMRSPLLSALGILITTSATATAIGLLVALTVEWGVISGAVKSGQFLELVLVGEAAVVLVVAALVSGTRRRRRSR